MCIWKAASGPSYVHMSALSETIDKLHNWLTLSPQTVDELANWLTLSPQTVDELANWLTLSPQAVDELPITD